MCYQMQLFFVKCIERHAGLCTLRYTLRYAPAVHNASWLARDFSERAGEHFTAWMSRRVTMTTQPTQSFPGYMAARDDVTLYLFGGAEQDPAAFAEGVVQRTSAGALLLGCFHSCYCLLLEDFALPACVQRRAQLLCEYFGGARAQRLGFRLVLRMLVHFTTLSVGPQTGEAGGGDESHRLFRFSPKVALESILHARAVVHAVAVAMAAATPAVLGTDRSCVLLSAVLAQVMFHPRALDCSYFPQMPVNLLYRMMETMCVGNSNRRARWFYCRNNHPYFVDACGRPMAVAPCSECGVLVGGLHHTQLEYIGAYNIGVPPNFMHRSPGVRPLGEVQRDRDVDPALQGRTACFLSSVPQDHSPPRYCLNPGTGDTDALSEVCASIRGVPAPSCCMQRLVLHAALVAGAEFGGSRWLSAARAFSSTDVPAGDDALRELVIRRYTGDWKRLACVVPGTSSEDLAMLVHGVLTQLAKEQPNAVDTGCTPDAILRVDTHALLSTRESRAAWEHAVHALVTGPMLSPDTLQATLRSANVYADDAELRVAVMLQDDDGTGTGTSIGTSTGMSTGADGCSAGSMLPLFRYRQSYSFTMFEQCVLVARDAFPLLHGVLSGRDDLRLAERLSSALDWVRAMLTRYSRRITREDACSRLTVADALDVDGGHGAAAAWNGFRTAWLAGRHMGVPIECGTVTPTGIPMAPSQYLAYCLPTKEDHGLLAKALLSVMADCHNRVCALSDARGEAVGTYHGDVATTRRQLVSSAAFTRAHVVCASFQGGVDEALARLGEFVRLQCVAHEPHTGKLVFDLAEAEAWVARTFFSECPEVRLDVELMRFAGDAAAADALLQLSACIPQESLTVTQADALRCRVNDAATADACLRKLTDILVVMSDAVAAAELDGESILWSVLMAREEAGWLGDVRLKHVAAVDAKLREWVADTRAVGEAAVPSPAGLADVTVRAEYTVRMSQAFVSTPESREYPAVDAAVLEALRASARALGVYELDAVLERLTSIAKEWLGGVSIVRYRPHVQVCRCAGLFGCSVSCCVTKTTKKKKYVHCPSVSLLPILLCCRARRRTYSRHLCLTKTRWKSVQPLHRHCSSGDCAWDISSPSLMSCGWFAPPRSSSCSGLQACYVFRYNGLKLAGLTTRSTKKNRVNHVELLIAEGYYGTSDDTTACVTSVFFYCFLNLK